MSGPLAPALEYALFAALLKREISLEDLDRKTLSYTGQSIHKGMDKLVKETGDWDEPGLALMVTEALGVDKLRYQEYISNVRKHETPAATNIYNVLKDRSALLQVSNEIQQQLATGDLDIGKLQTYLSAQSGSKTALTTIQDDLKDGEPTPPGGPKLETLPLISAATNGIFGVYVVAGVPAVGKSTLAKQFGWDIAKSGLKVLDYDIENTRNVLLYRMVQNFGLKKARELGKNIFIRDSLRTLSRDLSLVPPPALIIIDSIQKITTRGDDRRVGLDAWVHRFEELKQQGYSVVVVSEINRASYSGDPKMDCFKETGALEYAADSALVLQEADGGLIRLYLVKNRHYETKGQIGLMDRKKPFWFRELETGLGF